MISVTEKSGGVVFTVRVIPRASRSEVIGEVEGALKVKLTSPPVEGAANEELIKLFANRLDVSRSAIAIVAGESSRTKRIRIDGVAAEAVQSLAVR